MSNQEGNLAVKTLHNFLTVYHHFRTSNRQISEHGIQPRSIFCAALPLRARGRDRW